DAVGIQLDGLLEFDDRVRAIAHRRKRLGQDRVSLSVTRLRLQDLPDGSLGLIELPARNEQGRVLELRVKVVGVESYGLQKLTVGCLWVLGAQVGTSKLVVRGGKSGVDFDRIAEFDYCFVQLAFAEVLLPA